MTCRVLALLLALLIVDPAGAGDVKKPTLDRYLCDHAETRGFMLGRPVAPRPAPDGKSILFLRSQPRSAKLRLFEYDLASKKTRELLTPEQVLKGAEEKLSPEEKARRERMRVSVGGFTSFQLSPDGKNILLSLSGKLYLFDRHSTEITELRTGAGSVVDPKFSPDGKLVSFVRDRDVFALDLKTNEERRLTTGGSELISHGAAEFVAQEEMGRFSGYWWSPDSKAIAYQETDARGVEVWRVADPSQPEAEPHSSFYPRPGKANVLVRLGITAVAGGKTTWVEWDREKYPYLTSVFWPKADLLLVGVQTRRQEEWVVLKVDPKTGKSQPLVREQDSTWVNLVQDLPHWLPDNKGFLWVSERDGGPQLEWRGPNGRVRGVLAPASLGYRQFLSYNPKRDEVFFTASSDPRELHVYRTGLEEGGEPVRLSKEPGLHSAVVGPEHDFFVLTSRLRDEMPRTTVYSREGTQLGKLPSIALEPPFTPQVEYVEVGSKQKFFAAILRPRDKDHKKPLPVIVDVYGGPHHIHVLASQQRWLLNQWLADQGFIVVAIDNRGTPGRGRDWERAIYQKFGSLPLDDQVTALKTLGKKYPEMDLERVGIDGWSFGGYLAALAVLRRPDVFKAGVAGAPVVDWLDYDTHYTERYLGVPPKDDGAYRASSLLTYAAELKRPLLILHGTADDNVYFRHSLRLTDALFRAGKEFEVLPLSGLTHMVPDPEVFQALHVRIARFFQKHLR